MKCSALYEDEDEDGIRFVRVDCPNEARWLSCTPVINIPVCADHKCRCNKPFLEKPKTVEQLTIPGMMSGHGKLR